MSAEKKFDSRRERSGGSSGTSFAAVAGIIAIIAISIITLSFIGCSGKKGGGKSAAGPVVVSVAGVPVYENQFRFFSTLVLNQEGTLYTLLTEDNIDRNATVKNSVLNFVKEYIYRLKECETAGLTLTDEERAEVLDSIKAEYEQYKTVGDVTYEGDGFYNYYYGITEKQYTDFWLDWALIEKYNSEAEAQADVSETAQQNAYDYFEKYLYGRECTVLSLSLEGLTDTRKEVILTLANELTDQIASGADMGALIEKHCDDEALRENSGKLTVTSLMQNSFPELYEWVMNAADGELGKIVTDKAVYIARVDSTQDFSTLKDTDTMIEWTRMYSVDRDIDALVNSGKYDYVINDSVYNGIDLTDIIDRTLTSWNSYYALSEDVE
jgi:hypothetical protein